MRLIDLDELLKFPIRRNHCDKENANPHFINGIETVFEYAEQLPTLGWIPVSERLPEENEHYIVTVNDECCSIWAETVVVYAEYFDGSWWWNENGTEKDISDMVTHWMPLPPAPKDGE